MHLDFGLLSYDRLGFEINFLQEHMLFNLSFYVHFEFFHLF